MKTKIKKISLIFLSQLLLSFLVYQVVIAGDGKLTNEKVLQTVTQVLPCFGKCKMKVIGIQELSQDNAAQADIEISNITFERPKNDAVTAYAFGPGGGTYLWSGNATAVFGHYSDGKWVLRQIVTLEGGQVIGTWNNLNIVVGSKQQNEGTQRLDKEKVEAEHLNAEEAPVKIVMKAKKAKKARILANEISRDGRFIAYDNGTVLDTQTNLMWAAKDNGSNINWQGAKSYCENYRGGGYTDWRMPTQDELAGLYDADKSRAVACNTKVQIHVATELIDITCFSPWASETRGSDQALFFFTNGTESSSRQSYAAGPALPVRSGK